MSLLNGFFEKILFLQNIRLTNLALKKISINWIFYLPISSYNAI